MSSIEELKLAAFGGGYDPYAKPTMTPDQAMANYRAAREFNTPLSEVSESMVDELKAKQAMRGAGPAFMKSMAEPTFRAAVRGQEDSVKKVENGIADWALKPTGGSMFDPKETGSFMSSVMQGVGDLKLAYLGWQAYGLRNDLDEVREGLRAKPNDPELLARQTAITKDIGKLSRSMALVNNVSKAFGENTETARLQQEGKETWSDAEAVFEQFVRSITTFAPAIAGSIGVGAATGGTGYAGTAAYVATGTGSGLIDYTVGLQSQMAKNGVNLDNPNDIYYFLAEDSRFGAAKSAQARHAVGVGAVDALSARFGGVVAAKVYGRAAQHVPAPALIARDFYKGSIARAVGMTTAQTTVGAAGGALGEATGQVLEEGKVSDIDAVITEAVTGLVSAPVEYLAATKGAIDDARVRARSAEIRGAKLAAATQYISESELLKKDSDFFSAFIKKVGEEVPEARRIDIDIASLHQEKTDIYEALLGVLPDRAEEISKAAQLGTAVELTLEEYGRAVQDERVKDALVDFAAPAGEPTRKDAKTKAESISEAKKFAIVRFRKQLDPAWKDSYNQVVKALDEVLGTKDPVQTTERAAILSLTLSQISNIAKDTGMMPHEIWDTYGYKAILGPNDVTRNDDGTITLNTPLAKGAFRKTAVSESKALQQTATADTKTPAASPTNPATGGDTVSAEGNAVKQGNRGEYFPDQRTIIRWADADRSTLLHETGHWFLHTRVAIALGLKRNPNLTESQKHFVESTERVVKWLGAKDLEHFSSLSLDESRAMHEKFTRTYEQYLKEGRAPVSGLVTLFAKFSSWLMRVYGALTSVKDAEKLNPEVREMFDLLFVSHEQVKEAQLRRDLFTILDAAKRDEITGHIKGHVAYEALDRIMEGIDAATLSAFYGRSGTIKGYLEQLRKGRIEDYEKAAAELRKTLTKEEIARRIGEKRINATKKLKEGLQAINSKGKAVTVRPQFYEKELRARGVTEEQIVALKAQRMIASKRILNVQLDTDKLVEHLGYTSLDELVQDFTRDPFDGLEPDVAVQDDVEARIQDEYPEYATQESIEESAEASIFNDAVSEAIALEINLFRVAEGKPVTLGLFKAIAEAELRDVSLANISAYRYRQAVERIGTQAQLAIADGNLKAAGHLKRLQLVQVELAKQAQEVKDRAEKFVKDSRAKFNRKKTHDKLPLSYLKQIESVLNAVGVTSVALEDTPEWQSFAAEEGKFISLPTLPEAVQEGKLFAEMTVAEATETMDFVKNLVAAGRERQSIAVEGRIRALEDADTEVAAAIEANAAEKELKPVERNDRNNNFALSFKHHWRNFWYGHARIQSLFAVLEGKRNGKLYEIFGSRFDAARDRANELKYEKTQELYLAFMKLRDGLRSTEKKFYKTLDGSFTKHQMIAIALNTGNDGNFEKLLEGSVGYVDFRDKDKLSRKWTREDVLTALSETFTLEEFGVIQQIWNVYGSLGEELYDLNVRTRNEQVDKVKPSAVMLKTSDKRAVALSGGYYPISYDRGGSTWHKGEDRYEEGLGVTRGRSAIGSGTAQSKERQEHEHNNPISLNVNVGFDALNGVINDLCWREVLIDFNKLIGDKTRTSEAIRTYFGSEVLDTMRSWTESMNTMGASDQSNGALDKVLSALGAVFNVPIAVVTMGFNLVTTALQPIGMIQSVAVVGGKWVTKGTLEYVSSPRQTMRMVMEKSSLMRSRSRTRFKELAEVQTQFTMRENNLIGKYQDARDWIARYALAPIAYVQKTMVDVPTWVAAYDRYCEEGAAQGLSGKELEEFAVSRADRAVVDAQGSGDLSDLGSVERTKSIWNAFYSFFGTALNAAWVSAKTEKGMERAINMLLILVAQQVVDTMFRTALDGLGGDDDEEYVERLKTKIPADLASFYASLFIGVREVNSLLGALAGGDIYSYRGPTGLKPLNDAFALAKQIQQGEWDTAARKATVNMVGDLMGLPAVEINRLWDAVDEGDITYAIMGYKGD